LPLPDRAKTPRWDPALYGRFADLRERPAADLIVRIPLDAPQRIVDLGCGPGAVTARLAARFANAAIDGVDISRPMLDQARALGLSRVTWIERDIVGWVPDAAPDLIFSNAALQWLGDHAGLFPRLFGFLAPGGVLAVQMPANHRAPSHEVMIECAGMDRFAATLGPILRPEPVKTPAFYHDLLADAAAALDIWETEYLQVLEGEDPVVSFVSGTGLKPLLDALGQGEREAFLALYTERIRAAYPKRRDGKTLFPFRRLFLIARARPG
jgi:trans-aconitate 2-methyltransferase